MLKFGGYDVRNVLKLPRDQMLAFARYRLALKICPGLAVAPEPSKASEPQAITSPYRDTVQIAVRGEATVTPADFPDADELELLLGKEGGPDKTIRAAQGQSITKVLEQASKEGWSSLLAVRALRSERQPPLAQGSTRNNKTFKPDKVIVTESIEATFAGSGLPDRTLAASVDNADDALLVVAFSGSQSILQSPPSADAGIPGQVFGWGCTGNGVDWPVIKEGADLTMGWAILPTVMNRIVWACRKCGTPEDRLPPGYDPRPRSVRVIVRATLLGKKVVE